MMLLRNEKQQPVFDIPHTIFAFSRSLGLPPAGAFIDGVKMNDNTMGYSIVALAPDGRDVLWTRSFATYADPKAPGELESMLDALPPGAYIVAITTGGAGVLISGGMLRALQDFGMATLLDPAVPTSHAMIGRKGLPRGGALESGGIYRDSEVFLFDSRMFVDLPGALALADKFQARTVVLGGVSANDTVVIIEPEK